MPDRTASVSSLGSDFMQRLETSLQAADRHRRRRAVLRRGQQLVPFLLLAGPLLAWRLMLSSPSGAHVVIAALARLTFALDIAVHLDTVILAYVNLQFVPSLVGVLLLILIAGWLLPSERGEL